MWGQLHHSYVSSLCQAEGGKWSKDPIVCLTLDLTGMLCGLWAFVPLVHGIYRKQTSTDGFLKIKCWLSSTDNLPQVWSWQQEMVNKHGKLQKRGRHIHAKPWGHSLYKHHATNAASISELMDSINKRPLMLHPLFNIRSSVPPI